MFAAHAPGLGGRRCVLPPVKKGMAMGGQSDRRGRGRALLASLMLVASLSAQAASDTGTLAVSATVMARTGCLFLNSSNPVLAFGVIDQAAPSPGNVTASTQVTVRCRGNFWVNWSLSLNDGVNPSGTGARRLRHATLPTELMPYTLTATPTSGSWLLFWAGRQATINISGTIMPADYLPVAAGDYSDTVTLTLSF